MSWKLSIPEEEIEDIVSQDEDLQDQQVRRLTELSQFLKARRRIG
jgi:hypothetical protein